MEKNDKAATHVHEAVTNKPKEIVRKKRSKSIPMRGKVYITATFNNTIITVTDLSGNTLFWNSTGKVGFRGTRKSTPFAASKATEDLITKVVEGGMKQVDVILNGPGMGRDAAVRAIKNAGLKITSLADVTPIPHNGCRPKGRRRV